jgi:hypothetical protein
MGKSTRARWPVIMLFGAVALSTAAGGAGAASEMPNVTCAQSGGIQAHSGHVGHMRVVLGGVSVASALLTVVDSTGMTRWRYFAKAGLNIRSGMPDVTVMVPAAWRADVEITWGNNTPAVAALRVERCPRMSGIWNGYPGGFVLRNRSACVPLIFEVGQQASTVRFGIGHRCA